MTPWQFSGVKIFLFNIFANAQKVSPVFVAVQSRVQGHLML